jgi:hypothetical protein
MILSAIYPEYQASGKNRAGNGDIPRSVFKKPAQVTDFSLSIHVTISL